MVTKLSKITNDFNFVDPVTMETKCSFNACASKFTIEDHEVKTNSKGSVFFEAFHVCNECGQKYVAKSDKVRAAKMYREFQSATDKNFDPNETSEERKFRKWLAANPQDKDDKRDA